MIVGPGALEACAAEHDIEIVDADVVPDALPQELDHRTDRARLEDATAVQLAKVEAALAGDHRLDMEAGMVRKRDCRSAFLPK